MHTFNFPVNSVATEHSTAKPIAWALVGAVLVDAQIVRSRIKPLALALPIGMQMQWKLPLVVYSPNIVEPRITDINSHKFGTIIVFHA